jgi:hypothetical protein
MAEDRRAAARVEILGELSGEATVSQPLVIRELGPHGAQVETSYPLHVDSVHEFRLALGDTAVVLRARVAHCHISDIDQTGVVYRAGIEFVDPPSRTAQVIASFLAGMKLERRG